MATGDKMTTFWTREREDALKEPLDDKLTKQRDAYEGGKRRLTYLEGHTVIAQANRIFGFDGWSYWIKEMGQDVCTEGEPQDWNVVYWAIVTAEVGGVQRQDLGTSEMRNGTYTDKKTGELKIKDNVHNADARGMGRKAAVTDALKRALRGFGNQFGNSLYDEDKDVFAWMEAHALRSAEEMDDLRVRCAALLAKDEEAAAKVPKSLDEMTGDQLQKTIEWLTRRASQPKKTQEKKGDNKGGAQEEESVAQTYARLLNILKLSTNREEFRGAAKEVSAFGKDGKWTDAQYSTLLGAYKERAPSFATEKAV